MDTDTFWGLIEECRNPEDLRVLPDSRAMLSSRLTIVAAMLVTVFGCAPRQAQEAGPPASRIAPRTTPRDMDKETWGIARLSVASAREAPDHEAEMGTQVLMGHSVRAWQQYASDERPGTWFGVETQDGYRAWLEKETFIRCSRQELDNWNQSELLIVTAMEDCILENPRADAQAVSDVVIGNLVKRTGERAGWHAVALPDGRRGYLAGNSAEPYRAWRAARKPTAEAIEQTGRRFLGRPYLWGGNSPKGLDCSGFVKLVFFLNGIDLLRNASQQARQGVEVPLEPAFSRLKKGDLVFFGRQRGAGRPERVTHVGIYLEDGLFIHCLGRVQVSDLDPSSPIWEDYRLQVFCARRLLP